MGAHVEELVYAALRSAFTNGLWPDRAPDNTEPPYGSFIYFGATDNYLDATQCGIQQKTVQVDCYAETTAEAEAMADACEALAAVQRMDSSPPSATWTPTARRYLGKDPDTQDERVSLEFTVSYRPNG